MVETDDSRELPPRAATIRAVLVPIAALVVFVAAVAGLVLGGVVQGDEPRVGPAGSTTMPLTTEILP